ncbi:MAG: hypothetical protein IJG09_02880 [Methanobrevibacter sp.]|nr:hypothetical protein [Methanobrevibacter sp.]
MKRIIITSTLILLLMCCAYASDSTVEINGIDFEIPDKYFGGELDDNKYELENIFSIRCIDDNVPNAIGLWAEEHDYTQDLTIASHPVRYFYQYNEYVHDNQSHAYFASGDSVYEITWAGNEITDDIEKLIKSTPPSNIDEDSFYSALDISYELYKTDKIEKLNQDAQYNHLEAKYHSLSNHQNSHDNTRFKEILITYYNNH